MARKRNEEEIEIEDEDDSDEDEGPSCRSRLGAVRDPKTGEIHLGVSLTPGELRKLAAPIKLGEMSGSPSKDDDEDEDDEEDTDDDEKPAKK